MLCIVQAWTCQDNYWGPLLFCLVRLNIPPGTPRCGGPYVLFNPEIEQETCVGATKQGLLSKSVVLGKNTVALWEWIHHYPCYTPGKKPLHYKHFCRYSGLLDFLYFTLVSLVKISFFVVVLFSFPPCNGRSWRCHGVASVLLVLAPVVVGGALGV